MRAAQKTYFMLAGDRKRLRKVMENVFDQYRLNYLIRDKSEQLDEECRRIEAAVDCLADIEKRIITARFMKDDYVFDSDIVRGEIKALEHPISTTTYNNVLYHSLYKLALKLEIRWTDEVV